MLAFGCGGLAGAIFTQWYTNRSTVVEYTVNKTVLGTDQTTVVPNFRVQVGDTTLRTLYIYTVRLQYRSGPEIENAKVGVELTAPSLGLIGNTVVEKPSEALDFACAPFQVRSVSSGTTCNLRRLNSNVGAYTVSFATDEDARVEVSIDAKNTRLTHAETADSNRSLPVWGLAIGVLLATVGSTLSKFATDRLFDYWREGLRGRRA